MYDWVSEYNKDKLRYYVYYRSEMLDNIDKLKDICAKGVDSYESMRKYYKFLHSTINSIYGYIHALIINQSMPCIGILNLSNKLTDIWESEKQYLTDTTFIALSHADEIDTDKVLRLLNNITINTRHFL